jgi:hypothetical protein
MIKKDKWHNGLVVERKGDKRSWVILYISQYEIESQGLNADKEGYYGFGGMWYGDDPNNNRSYGKIIELDENEITFNGTVLNYNLQELKALVD